jgi:hypothetical protein
MHAATPETIIRDNNRLPWMDLHVLAGASEARDWTRRCHNQGILVIF